MEKRKQRPLVLRTETFQPSPPSKKGNQGEGCVQAVGGHHAPTAPIPLPLCRIWRKGIQEPSYADGRWDHQQIIMLNIWNNA